MTTSSSKLKSLALTAILAALVVLLQLTGGIPIGPFSITLTLIPIVVGAILLGWQYGTVLGLIFGIVVSILSITGKDPGGFMVFQASPVMGWVVCLLKGAAAGFLPAVIYRFFASKKYAAHIFMGISGAFLFLGGFAVGKLVTFDAVWKNILFCLGIALLAAIYLILALRAVRSENTAVYLAAMIAPVANTGIFIIGMLLFFRDLLTTWAGGTDLYFYLLTAIIGINFVIEFAVAVILSPAVASIVKATGALKK